MTIPFVLLRVPIIFVLDEFFKSDFDSTVVANIMDVNNEYTNDTVYQTDSAEFAQSTYSYVLQSMVKIIVCCASELLTSG